MNEALTRYDIDLYVEGLETETINIHCDAWAFRKIKYMYEGWLGVPYPVSGGIQVRGVHPIAMKDFIVTWSQEYSCIEFVDENENVKTKIEDYSRSM